MQSLKFLGKPAPDKVQGDDMYFVLKRSEHLEGAIKEAAKLLETDLTEWPKSAKEEGARWASTYRGLEPEMVGLEEELEIVAFLLRKTIGEK